MEIVELPIATIDIGARLRAVDPDHIRFIAHSMAEAGQLTPIDVRPLPGERYALMAGAHRIEARRMAGFETVFARVQEVDALTAQMIEVDENLMRHELTALDRAAFLARRKEIYLALHPDTGRGGKRKKNQTELEFGLPSFTKDAAAKLDLTPRWIEIAIGYHNRLASETRRRLSGTRLADNAKLLIDLSRLPEAEQEAVVAELLRADRPARNVAQAEERLFGRGKPAIDPTDKKYRRFVLDWTNGGPALQGEVIGFLRRQGYKISGPKA